MDEVAAAQGRERVTRWVQEGREVLGLLPALLASESQMSAKSEQAERDAERLRKENADLRRELGDARKDGEDARKLLGGLQAEAEELKRENLQLRSEKDEAAQAFGRLLETVQATNQIAQKLGVMKSPFARPREGSATPSPPAGPTPNE